MVTSFRYRVIEETAALEALPTTVVELTQVASDPDSGVSDVANVLNLDQALLGKTLAEANSANSASRTLVGTATDAVMRLGVSRVVARAVSESVSDFMDMELRAYGLDRGELSRHAKLASVCAEVIRSETNGQVPNELVTASLLHDIGKLVMGPLIEDGTIAALREAHQSGESWSAAENDLLGIEHAEVGRVVCAAWGLPEAISTAVQLHHTPERGEGPLAYGVCLADAIAHAVEAGGDLSFVENNPVAMASVHALGIDPGQLDWMLVNAEVIWAERSGSPVG